MTKKRLEGLRGLPFQWLLPLFFFCIGLLYLYASPHFESPDSIYHIGMIKWIAEHGSLPEQSPDHDHLHGQEASQPPLYYLLMRPIWLAIDSSDFDAFYQRNPLVEIGYPKWLGNRNMVFYRQPYPPPLNGASLAITIIRLLSLGMGAATVFAVYRGARILIPHSIGFALLASSLTAFNPQFLFIASSVNNDNLVTMLASIITWQTLAMLRGGFDIRRSLLLGLLIALASLSKLSGLVMVPALALAGLWLAYRFRDLRGLCVLGGAMLGTWLLIAGWWFLRNITLYGELFGTSAMLAKFGGRSTTLPRLFIEEFEGLRRSYWGLFGWFSNFTSEAHYLAMDLLTALALVGLAVYLIKRRKDSDALAMFVFLGAVIVIGAAMLIWYTLQTTASQGRLLFPYIAAISLMLALGLRALRLPPLFIALPMALFSLLAPSLYIIPRYDHPPQVHAPPSSAIATYAKWNDITLIAHEAPAPQRWTAGDEIPFTLYWQPLALSDRPLALFISLIDSSGNSLETFDTFPGWGTLPTTWWQPGAIYRDDYILQIPPDAQGLSTVQLHIGWYAYPDGSHIRPLLANGEEAAAYTIPIGAFVSTDADTVIPADARPNDAVFGSHMLLAAHRFIDGRTLELYWTLLDKMQGDWRVLAIVFAQDFQPDHPFEILMQADKAPAVPLDYLHEGETLRTTHSFTVTEQLAGQRPIYVGWYNFATGQRLAIPHAENMLKLPAAAFHSDEA